MSSKWNLHLNATYIFTMAATLFFLPITNNIFKYEFSFSFVSLLCVTKLFQVVVLFRLIANVQFAAVILFIFEV